MKFILGRKIGMTRVYDDKGMIQPVTVIQAGPCTVTQVKTADKDGYTAIQIGYGTKKHQSKPEVGHLRSSKLTSAAVLSETRVTSDESHEVGQTIDVTTFAVGDTVTVVGTGKGKGFQGVMKRHNFHGGPGSHGSDFHRAPGSIGGRWPQRVVKGRKLPGHMGAERVTIKNLRVIKVMPEDNLLAISGAIPGPIRSIIEIRG